MNSMGKNVDQLNEKSVSTKPVLAFYDVKDMAIIFGCCVTSIGAMVKRGDIPPPCLGGKKHRRWWRKSKINKFIGEG